MIIKKHRNNLNLLNCSKEEMEKILTFLENDMDTSLKIEEYPTWDKWSDHINIMDHANSLGDISEFKRSGVYKIYHKKKLIYIGETRCDGSLSTKDHKVRNGMWARRGDFRSTALSNGTVKNPYGNALSFLEKFGVDELKNVTHRFHVVSPEFCLEAETDLLQQYYDKHKTLPILQTEIDYKRVQ